MYVTQIPQLEKIRGACEIARQRGLQWMWIDTCCINKTSTVEENESINSMFKWYRDAKLCVTYLDDVRIGGKGPPAKERNINKTPDIFRSIVDNRKYTAWFSRGCTLQELLAPRHMEFYDADM